QLADRIITIGTRTFIDEWLTQPLFSSLTREQAGRDERLVNTPEGLANSLRTSGTGTQDNLWPRLGEVSTRTLLVVGERDQKFLEIARRMSNALPNAPLSVISSAGHSAHLEQPAKVAVDLARFLNREVA
ncbi:MAG: 2-succinyl-6-hydroxy-2,4-cyclohexadiene-1-carboxylate synthase, partial [Ilumatobacteraceae bacterium]